MAVFSLITDESVLAVRCGTGMSKDFWGVFCFSQTKLTALLWRTQNYAYTFDITNALWMFYY